MPRFDIDSIYIEPSEFIDECSKRDITNLIEILIEDGYIDVNNLTKDNLSPSDELFVLDLVKISDNKYRLTIEEEEIIKKIANRL